MNMFHTPTQTVPGSRANLNLLSPASSTGSYWSPSPRRNLWPRSATSSAPSTPSSPALRLPQNMYGRMTPRYPTPASSLAASPFAEIQNWTGNQFGPTLNQAILNRFLRQYVFRVIAPSELLHQIMEELSRWIELAMCTGAELALVNPDLPGNLPDQMLIVRIPDPSFGTVTKVNQTLSSMNFEEVSTLPICCVGSIDIHAVWKLKDLRNLWLPQISGSPQTWTQDFGIPR